MVFGMTADEIELMRKTRVPPSKTPSNFAPGSGFITARVAVGRLVGVAGTGVGGASVAVAGGGAGVSVGGTGVGGSVGGGEVGLGGKMVGVTAGAIPG